MKIQKINMKPFDSMKILKCKIEKGVNEHITLYVQGYLKYEEELKFEDNKIVLEGDTEDGRRECLFRGMITKLKTKAGGKWLEIELEAKSFTALLDSLRSIRVFQDTHKSIGDIVRYVNQKNQDVRTIFGGMKNQGISQLIVQYRETDWEFLKRMAAIVGTYIVSDCIGRHICYYFGMPQNHVSEMLDTFDYSLRICNDLNGKFIYEYEVVSGEVFELGSSVNFLGKSMRIYHSILEYVHGEFINTYKLRGNRETTEYQPNSGVAGVSLKGCVAEVKNESVRVDVLCDADVKNHAPVWLPYATVYSSPKGTGWYCMPEIGDAVYIYFPEADEKNAYVISAMHITDRQGLRTNPDVKFFRTAHDKEIRFEPDRIVLTNNKGLSVILDDRHGIILKSDSTIKMDAASIVMESGKSVSVAAQRAVVLKQRENSIVINNGIRQRGVNVQLK